MSKTEGVMSNDEMIVDFALASGIDPTTIKEPHMRFYRVRYSAEGGNSGGYSWHTSQKEAEKAAREARRNDPDEYRNSPDLPAIEVIQIIATRDGILDALKVYGSHPNNG